MRPKPATQPSPQSRDVRRVIWTDAEKEKLVKESADLQAQYPDLAGLPLLRSAMRTLPTDRRRKLIAVSQASWFEPAFTAEVKRRTSELVANASVLPIANSFVQTQNGWHKEHADWMAKTEHLLRIMAQSGESQTTMLSLVHRELVAIHSLLRDGATRLSEPRLYSAGNDRRNGGQPPK